MRVKREEAAITQVRAEIADKCTDLGKLVLSLYQSGAIDIPQITGQVQQITRLQELIRELEQNIAEIRAEEQLPSDEESAGHTGTSVSTPTEKRAPCPQCTYLVSVNATFCPGCGYQLSDLSTSARISDMGIESEQKEVTLSTVHPQKSLQDVPDHNICSECGDKLPLHATFCPVCGAATNTKVRDI
jgi:rubrerythrin